MINVCGDRLPVPAMYSLCFEFKIEDCSYTVVESLSQRFLAACLR